MIPDEPLATALEAVRNACAVCRAVQERAEDASALAKDDRSPVTIADFAAQAVIIRALNDAFPGDPVVAEEDSSQLRRPENAPILGRVCEHVRSLYQEMGREEILRTIDRGDGAGGPSERFWTLDPIDGTKGFLRGDQYAVALALVEDGEVVLGVLGCPNLPPLLESEDGGDPGSLFHARRGSGSWMEPLWKGGDPIRLTTAPGTGPPRFCEPYEPAHSAHEISARVAALMNAAPPVRLDSQAKYGVVARGEADAYLRLPTRPGYEEKIWDHAAGSLLVREAGGRVTDIEGRALDFRRGRTLKGNRGIVAAAGGIHERVLRAVREALAQSTPER